MEEKHVQVSNNLLPDVIEEKDDSIKTTLDNVTKIIPKVVAEALPNLTPITFIFKYKEDYYKVVTFKEIVMSCSKYFKAMLSHFDESRIKQDIPIQLDEIDGNVAEKHLMCIFKFLTEKYEATKKITVSSTQFSVTRHGAPKKEEKEKEVKESPKTDSDKLRFDVLEATGDKPFSFSLRREYDSTSETESTKILCNVDYYIKFKWGMTPSEFYILHQLNQFFMIPEFNKLLSQNMDLYIGYVRKIIKSDSDDEDDEEIHVDTLIDDKVIVAENIKLCMIGDSPTNIVKNDLIQMVRNNYVCNDFIGHMYEYYMYYKVAKKLNKLIVLYNYYIMEFRHKHLQFKSITYRECYDTMMTKLKSIDECFDVYRYIFVDKMNNALSKNSSSSVDDSDDELSKENLNSRYEIWNWRDELKYSRSSVKCYKLKDLPKFRPDDYVPEKKSKIELIIEQVKKERGEEEKKEPSEVEKPRVVELVDELDEEEKPKSKKSDDSDEEEKPKSKKDNSGETATKANDLDEDSDDDHDDSVEMNKELLESLGNRPSLIEGEHTIYGKEQFWENFHKCSDNIFKGIDWNGFVISGGFVLAMINKIQDCLFETSDIDVFVCGDQEKIQKTVKKLLRHFKKIEPNIQFVFTAAMIIVIRETNKRAIQIIFNRRHPHEVVEKFDLSHLQIYCYQEKVFATLYGLWSLKHQMTYTKYHILRADRVYKAIRNGFLIRYTQKMSIVDEPEGEYFDNEKCEIDVSKLIEHQVVHKKSIAQPCIINGVSKRKTVSILHTQYHDAIITTNVEKIVNNIDVNENTGDYSFGSDSKDLDELNDAMLEYFEVEESSSGREYPYVRNLQEVCYRTIKKAATISIDIPVCYIHGEKIGKSKVRAIKIMVGWNTLIGKKINNLISKIEPKINQRKGKIKGIHLVQTSGYDANKILIIRAKETVNSDYFDESGNVITHKNFNPDENQKITCKLEFWGIIETEKLIHGGFNITCIKLLEDDIEI